MTLAFPRLVPFFFAFSPLTSSRSSRWCFRSSRSTRCESIPSRTNRFHASATSKSQPSNATCYGERASTERPTLVSCRAIRRRTIDPEDGTLVFSGQRTRLVGIDGNAHSSFGRTRESSGKLSTRAIYPLYAIRRSRNRFGDVLVDRRRGYESQPSYGPPSLPTAILRCSVARY